jgi:Tol biopolymer transport system component
VERVYDRIFYKLDGYGNLPLDRAHIWLIDAHTGKAKQLTDHPVWDESFPAFSPDGKWIVFSSNHSPDPDLEETDDLFLTPVTGEVASSGSARKLKTPEGSK